MADDIDQLLDEVEDSLSNDSLSFNKRAYKRFVQLYKLTM